MDSWHPHDLVHCVDSDFLGYAIASMAFGVLIWYWIIASIWFRSMWKATKQARTVWGTLALIFIVCSMAGYVSWDVSLWFPKAGVIIRVTALVALNILCPVFILLGVRHKFMAYGMYQKLGESFADVNFDNMSDHEVATMTKALLAEAKVSHASDEERVKCQAMPRRELLGRAGVCLDVLLDRELSKHEA